MKENLAHRMALPCLGASIGSRGHDRHAGGSQGGSVKYVNESVVNGTGRKPRPSRTIKYYDSTRDARP
jgi:hypothetical protein